MRRLIRNTLTGIVMAGAGLTSCESTGESGGDEALLGILLMGAGVNAQASGVASRIAAGQAAQAAGAGLVQYGSAKAGKSDVKQEVHVHSNNVPTYSNGQTSTPQVLTSQSMPQELEKKIEEPKRPKIRNNGKRGIENYHPNLGVIVTATCNYIYDLDRDSYVRFPEEFVGLKHEFREDEKITAVLGTAKKVLSLSYKLLNQNGEIVDEDEDEDEGSELYGIIREYNHGENKRLEAGEFKALWYSGGRLLSSWDFGVVENDTNK